MHNLLFCAHTLCMNYVTNTFLLVNSSVRSKRLLCFVHGQGQKREQKPTTKKFIGFHNHSPLLTMSAWSRSCWQFVLSWLHCRILPIKARANARNTSQHVGSLDENTKNSGTFSISDATLISCSHVFVWIRGM